MRSFHKPAFESNVALDTKKDKGVGNHASDKILNIKIDEVTVLRKRPDANVPCDTQLDHSDDVKLLENIMSRVGCTPIYWNNFTGQFSNNFSECHSASELAKIYHYTQTYEDIFLEYVPPCIEMRVSTKFDKEEENKWQEPCMRILYTNPNYLNFVNVRSFGFESFISGLGGFIGIFLGYSLLQVPVLLQSVLSCFRSIKILGASTETKKIKRRTSTKIRATRKKHRASISTVP